MLLKSFPAYGVRLAKTHLKSRVQRYLYRTYMQAFLMITGNEAEKLGTGQSNNIIQRGCDNRVGCLVDIPEAYTEVVVSISLVFLIVRKELGLPFLGISIAVLLLTMRIAQYGNTMVARWREARRDRMRKADRSIVKVIMSKQEILQANTLMKEVETIDNELYQGGVTVAVKADKGLILSMDAQKLAFDLLRLTFVCYIAFQIIAGTMTIGDFSLFRGILRSFGANLEKVNETMTNYHQQIIYVTKLWSTFDTTPRIEGYEIGHKFVYQNGNIHLDSISFGYGTDALLQDFCLDIPGGKKTALVGLS
jgi:ATP-binding cassette subfamily B protein